MSELSKPVVFCTITHHFDWIDKNPLRYRTVLQRLSNVSPDWTNWWRRQYRSILLDWRSIEYWRIEELRKTWTILRQTNSNIFALLKRKTITKLVLKRPQWFDLLFTNCRSSNLRWIFWKHRSKPSGMLDTVCNTARIPCENKSANSNLTTSKMSHLDCSMHEPQQLMSSASAFPTAFCVTMRWNVHRQSWMFLENLLHLGWCQSRWCNRSWAVEFALAAQNDENYLRWNHWRHSTELHWFLFAARKNRQWKIFP